MLVSHHVVVQQTPGLQKKLQVPKEPNVRGKLMMGPALVRRFRNVENVGKSFSVTPTWNRRKSDMCSSTAVLLASNFPVSWYLFFYLTCALGMTSSRMLVFVMPSSEIFYMAIKNPFFLNLFFLISTNKYWFPFFELIVSAFVFVFNLYWFCFECYITLPRFLDVT